MYDIKDSTDYKNGFRDGKNDKEYGWLPKQMPKERVAAHLKTVCHLTPVYISGYLDGAFEEK